VATEKKSKVTDEGGVFKEQRTKHCFFTYYNGKPVWLTSKRSLSVLKEYNFKRHYDTNSKFSTTVSLVCLEMVESSQ
jgi:hypothetical protein